MARQIIKSDACFEVLTNKERLLADKEIQTMLLKESKNTKIVDTIIVRLKKNYTGKLVFENVNEKNNTCPTCKLAGITVKGLIDRYGLKQRKKYIAYVNDLGQIVAVGKEVK